MTKFRACAAALALGALALPHVAAAQECVSEREVASLYIYAVPPALKSARNSCEGQLAKDGFFATGGPALAQRYGALQDETWPGARRALLLFAAKAGEKTQAKSPSLLQGLGQLDPGKLLGALPDDVLRPLIETTIMQKVAQDLDPKDCRKIERVAKAMAPIDPKDAATLVGTVAGLVGLKDPQVCAERST